MLNSIINLSSLTLETVLICMAAELILGLLSAMIYTKLNRTTKSFAMTLALLPLIAGTVILVVNGNLGAGIAVAGSFSLIRFRSVQGSAKEILAVFLAMALGLCAGAGYVGVACILFAVYSLALLLLHAMKFGNEKQSDRVLKITIPESMDYDGLFDDVLNRFTGHWSLESVHTAEMGSVYQLVYAVTVADIAKSREMLDEIRIRNGNLNVALQRIAVKETM